MSVALDHLRAWALIIDAGQLPIYAPMSLVRSAIETSALCRWLVDPALSPTTRVARGISAQLDDYNERRRFETAIGAAEPEFNGTAQSGAQHHAELIRLRDAAGIPAVSFPGPTTIVGMYPAAGTEGTWPYRLTSAFSHGKTWSFLAMNIRAALEARDSGGPSAPITSDETILAGMTELAVGAVTRAVIDIESYLGIRIRDGAM